MTGRILAVLTFAAVASASAVADAQGRVAVRKATIVIVDRSPLEVRGFHFRRRERVKITVSAEGEASSKRVRATRRGSFTVRFDSVAIGHCTPFRIRAIGNRGSRAGVARSFVPDCYQP